MHPKKKKQVSTPLLINSNSPANIEKYFLVASKSNYVYGIRNSGATFNELCIFGTNNKFTSEDVKKSCNASRTELQKYEINAVRFSSDGDARLLKAMRDNAILEPSEQVSFTQGSIRITTKLRTIFFKPKVILPISNYFSTPDHLLQLMNTPFKN